MTTGIVPGLAPPPPPVTLSALSATRLALTVTASNNAKHASSGHGGGVVTETHSLVLASPLGYTLAVSNSSTSAAAPAKPPTLLPAGALLLSLTLLYLGNATAAAVQSLSAPVASGQGHENGPEVSVLASGSGGGAANAAARHAVELVIAPTNAAAANNAPATRSGGSGAGNGATLGFVVRPTNTAAASALAAAGVGVAQLEALGALAGARFTLPLAHGAGRGLALLLALPPPALAIAATVADFERAQARRVAETAAAHGLQLANAAWATNTNANSVISNTANGAAASAGANGKGQLLGVSMGGFVPILLEMALGLPAPWAPHYDPAAELLYLTLALHAVAPAHVPGTLFNRAQSNDGFALDGYISTEHRHTRAVFE